jgi:hypothetical protein
MIIYSQNFMQSFDPFLINFEYVIHWVKLKEVVIMNFLLNGRIMQNGISQSSKTGEGKEREDVGWVKNGEIGSKNTSFG